MRRTLILGGTVIGDVHIGWAPIVPLVQGIANRAHVPASDVTAQAVELTVRGEDAVASHGILAPDGARDPLGEAQLQVDLRDDVEVGLDHDACLEHRLPRDAEAIQGIADAHWRPAEDLQIQVGAEDLREATSQTMPRDDGLEALGLGVLLRLGRSVFDRGPQRRLIHPPAERDTADQAVHRRGGEELEQRRELAEGLHDLHGGPQICIGQGVQERVSAGDSDDPQLRGGDPHDGPLANLPMRRDGLQLHALGERCAFKARLDLVPYLRLGWLVHRGREDPQVDGRQSCLRW
mmetsp:Transcript_29861/g.69192  ORF Transcript_29861/g.69192 Transcript_29861/m.69192 type:complete len:292 (+) Transcript_29861:348-1223(+)